MLMHLSQLIQSYNPLLSPKSHCMASIHPSLPEQCFTPAGHRERVGQAPGRSPRLPCRGHRLCQERSRPCWGSTVITEANSAVRVDGTRWTQKGMVGGKGQIQSIVSWEEKKGDVRERLVEGQSDGRGRKGGWEVRVVKKRSIALAQ